MFTTKTVIEQDPKLKKKYKDKSGADIAMDQLLSMEYQDIVFRLCLIGSDEVVRSFNNLFQKFYQMNESEEKLKPDGLLSLTAILFYEVRKSLGNDKTKLHPFEMLEWKIKDLRTYKKNGKYPNYSKL